MVKRTVKATKAPADVKGRHSKGRWEAGRNAGIWCNGRMLAEIKYCIDKNNPFRVCDEEAKANADLIVAAPDLLSACKAQEEADNWFGASNTGQKLKDKAKGLRAVAIERAEKGDTEDGETKS